MSRIILYCPHCNAILVAFQDSGAKNPEKLVKKLMKNPHPHDCPKIQKQQEEYENRMKKYTERPWSRPDIDLPSKPKYGADKLIYIVPGE